MLLLIVLLGCDNQPPAEVPSAGGRPLAPAQSTPPEKSGSEATDDDDDDAAAWIDGEPIAASRVDEEVRRIERMYRAQRRAFPDSVQRQKREQVLHRLIDEALIEEWIAESDVAVSERDIDDEVRVRIAELYGTRAALDRHLAERASDIEEYRSAIRRELATAWLLDETDVQDADAGVNPELVDLYRDVVNRPATEMRMRLSSVLFPSDTTRSEVDKRLSSIRHENDFFRLADEISGRDPTLGWVPRTDVDQALAAQLMKVEPPGPSAPIKTPAGYQVYWVHEREHRPSERFDELKPVLKRRAESMRLSEDRRRLLERLREKAQIRYEEPPDSASSAAATGK